MHDVIDAITTAPWSSTKSPRSAEETRTGLLGLPPEPSAADGSWASSSANDSAAGSPAGNDSSTASSSLVSGAGLFSST